MHSDDKVKLSRCFPQHKKCEYEYDFGDGWTHTVELEKIMADYDDIFPVCSGEGGYDEFLEAIRNPRHPEHQEMIDRGEGQQYL